MDRDATDSESRAIEAALAAHRGGDLGGARRLYEDVLARDPDHGEALHLLGLVHYQEGDAGSAIALFGRALALSPDDPVLLRRWGSVLLGVGRTAEAAEAFASALAHQPDHPETLFNLGLCRRYLGDRDSAISLLTAAAAGLDDQAMVHYELGLVHQLAGRNESAVRAYRRALELDPNHADALNNLGVVFAARGDLDDAVAACCRALAVRPGFAAALNNLGAALMDFGDLEAAGEVIRAALSADQERVDSWISLGTLLRRLGRPETAVDAYRTALDLDPLAAAAHDNLAACLHDLGRGGEALDSVQAAAAAHPRDSRAHELLGEAFHREGNPEAAAASLAVALSLPCSNEAVVRLLRGEALVAAGHLAEGIAELERAAAQRPRHPPSQRALAGALLRRGDGAGAIAACERALAENAFDQEAIAYRALGLRLAGRADEAEAITDLERWITITTPDFPPGINDIDGFNRRLAADLLVLGSRRWQPAYQSIRGGTQTGNDLFTEPAGSIQTLRQAIEARLDRYIESMPADPDHPFPSGRPRRYVLRAWSVVLEDRGHHVSHIHPEGWLSGAYYVEVPDFAGDEAPGCIEFGGQPWSELPFASPPPRRRIPPAAGRLVLFPSYLWHGVRRFRSAGRRITVAFDLVPLER